MTCYHPITAYVGNGGRIVFDRVKSLTKVPLMLPCGQCVGCRLEKSRIWAMRCTHEARMSSSSLFVTLTYDDAHLPPGGSLSKTAVQLFMKRLRKAKGDGIRFYACGEYGDLNARPHYHLLLFNCRFDDRKFLSINGRGERLYHSAELARLWPFGYNTIGDVTFDSAAYVARYCMKKVTGEQAEDHYAVIDADGVVYDRLPEFALMSRRPGIGSGYYEKYGQEVRDHDTVIINNKPVKPPRFYDLKTEKAFPAEFVRIRRRRKKLARLNKDDNTPARLRVKEVIALRRLHEKKRGL